MNNSPTPRNWRANSSRHAALLAVTLCLAPWIGAQTRLTRPTGIHPYSLTRAIACTPDADWMFFGDGGTVAIQDARAATYAGAQNGADLAAAKVVPISSLGVVSADIRPHPDLDLEVDSDLDGIEENDPEDVLFIAGGHLGLWMMAADSRTAVPNRALRIDDQGNPSNPQTEQSSRRFCNQLAFVDVGNDTYLAATFAKKYQNHLRLYKLSTLLSQFAAATSETGWELDPDAYTMIGGRTGPFMLPTTSDRTLATSYVLGIAVDQLTATTADVYLAMNTHGVMRVGLASSGGSIVFTKTWGPMFGTDSPYATDVGGGNNASAIRRSGTRTSISTT